MVKESARSVAINASVHNPTHAAYSAAGAPDRGSPLPACGTHYIVVVTRPKPVGRSAGRTAHCN
jgi:hypothetical protein